MPSNLLIAAGVVLSALGLAWGLLMLLAPAKWRELTRVDWNPELLDVSRPSERLQIRIAGAVITALFGFVLGVCVYALI